MRQVYNTRELEIPADVEFDIKSKVVTVKGPRGTSARPVREQNEREWGSSPQSRTVGLASNGSKPKGDPPSREGEEEGT